MIDPDHPALHKIRGFALSHPGASERPSHGTPTFFVKEKHAFLSLWFNHHNDGRLAFCCAAPKGANAAMIADDPEVFFMPAYVGHLGWLGVRLDRDLPWKDVEQLVAGAYEVVAAKHGVGKSAPARTAAPKQKAPAKKAPAKKAPAKKAPAKKATPRKRAAR